MFLLKSLSQHMHVLDAADCPPHGIAFHPYDYPKYYDPVYHPEYNLHIFATSFATSGWLQTAISSHLSGCCDACRWSYNQLRRSTLCLYTCHVEYTIEKVFYITVESSDLLLSGILTVSDIERPSFHFARSFRTCLHTHSPKSKVLEATLTNHTKHCEAHFIGQECVRT